MMPDRESVIEQAEQSFSETKFECLLFNQNSMGHFIEWLSNSKPVEADRLMEEWLKTKEGKQFEDVEVEKIFDDLMERPEDPNDGGNR